jgi:hypothetical protein
MLVEMSLWRQDKGHGAEGWGLRTEENKRRDEELKG